MRARRALGVSGLAAALAVLVVAPGFAGIGGVGGSEPEPGSTRAAPKTVLFDGKKPASLRYRFRGEGPEDIRVRVVKGSSGRVVRSWIAGDREPRTLYERRWNGVEQGGSAAEPGRYRFRFKPTGTGLDWPGGSFVLRDHAHPVEGPHGSRGAIGDFGAPRNGGRIHAGYDVIADCGTPLVAARGGRVQKAGFDPVLFGWFVLIDGRKTSRDYFYSHLRDKPRVGKGDRVRTGERIGKVGQTGNARSTPCHLHFEIRTKKGPTDPEPALRRWDRWR
ncbi:MAG: peptidoglycan DD-metalloendopeptidase family protein [Solirubrobacterales bacterium]